MGRAPETKSRRATPAKTALQCYSALNHSSALSRFPEGFPRSDPGRFWRLPARRGRWRRHNVLHDGVWKLAIDPLAQFAGQRLNGTRRQRPGFIYSDFNTHNCPEAIYCLFIQLTACGARGRSKNISLSATSSGFHRREGDHGFIARAISSGWVVGTRCSSMKSSLSGRP